MKEQEMRKIFKALDADNNGKINKKFLRSLIKDRGFYEDHQELNEIFKQLKHLDGDFVVFNDFVKLGIKHSQFLKKIFTNNLVVADFKAFSNKIKEIQDWVLANVKGGKNASQIPALANVDSNKFAISICTVDGQKLNFGNFNEEYCIQSCSKVFTQLIAVDLLGSEFVHQYVGSEPSGVKFNEMVLKNFPSDQWPNKKIPHNPMINAGAINCCSMIKHNKSPSDRFDYMLDMYKKLAGGKSIGFDNTVYLSECLTADRNQCLGYMMKEQHSFPFEMNQNLEEDLNYQFQSCSINVTAEKSAIMAATLANGGVNPLTGTKVFESSHVKDSLSIMLSSGMQDYSGEWMFKVGVPAKSGVCGMVMSVIPNVCGIAVWSPPIDDIGNSVKGVQATQKIVEEFDFHGINFDSHNKLRNTELDEYIDVIKSIVAQDIHNLIQLFNNGVDLFFDDQDKRNSLHLAVETQDQELVAILITVLEEKSQATRERILNSTDRWGYSPLDTAIEIRNENAITLLREAGAKTFKEIGLEESSRSKMVTSPKNKVESPSLSGSEHNYDQDLGKTQKILYAAQYGDLGSLISYRIQDWNIYSADQDDRNALLVAVCEQKVNIVKQLVNHLPAKMKLDQLENKDRFNFTAMDQALKSGNQEIIQILKECTPIGRVFEFDENTD